MQCSAEVLCTLQLYGVEQCMNQASPAHYRTLQHESPANCILCIQCTVGMNQASPAHYNTLQHESGIPCQLQHTTPGIHCPLYRLHESGVPYHSRVQNMDQASFTRAPTAFTGGKERRGKEGTDKDNEEKGMSPSFNPHYED